MSFVVTDTNSDDLSLHNDDDGEDDDDRKRFSMSQGDGEDDRLFVVRRA